MNVSLVGVSPESWPIDSCSEHVIAAAARTSLNRHDKTCSVDADRRLVRRLYLDRHTSPIEMASVTFQVRAPKFVTIQMLRHRTFHVNEESQRYHRIPGDLFRPSSHSSLVRTSHPSNRQQSVFIDTPHDDLDALLAKTERHLDESFSLYRQLMDCGLARECARFCLPLATMSTIIVKTDLHNLIHFLRLRLADDAQYEIQLVARAMFHLTKQAFPTVMSAFENETDASLNDTEFEYH